MISGSVSFNTRDFAEAVRRDMAARAEKLALDVSHRAARRFVTEARSEMAGRGLGRLGYALGTFSDKDRGRVRRTGAASFSASGSVYIRSGSPRSRGAILSYTEGSDIRPIKGRWLWFPTDEMQRFVGRGRDRRRLEPGMWKQFGLDRKIGPLVQIKAANGNPLLVVRNIARNPIKPRGARSLTKRGKVPKGLERAEIVVMFIGIPRTSRQARIDVRAIARRQTAIMEQEIREAQGR